MYISLQINIHFRTENKSFTTTSGLGKNVELEKEFVLEASTATITQSGSTQTIELNVLPDVVISMQQVDNTDSDSKNNNSDTQALVSYGEINTKTSPMRKLQRSNTAKKLSDKRVNFSERSASQDTDGSHSTSTSSDIRLPPILIPIISSLENVKLSDQSEPILKRWESISSVEPIVDSSFSSMPSSSSDSEEETNKKQLRRVPTAFRRRANFSTMRSKSVCDPEIRRTKTSAKNSDNSENASNISTSTNVGSVGTSSTSGSDQNNKILRRENSITNRGNGRNIRSATISRRTERASSANRASTARVKSGKSLANLKSSEPVPKPMPVAKDREQGAHLEFHYLYYIRTIIRTCDSCSTWC